MSKNLKGDCRDAFTTNMSNASPRTAPTTPPPPAMLEADQLELRADELEAHAYRIIARTRDLRRAAAAMRRGEL
jgi:hypothetical protein